MAAPPPKIKTDFPAKLAFLFDPHPAKCIYGGRDGLKSHSAARALLIMGAQHRLRWLCARETQQSIAESVHQLLEDLITELGLHGAYRIEKARIIGTLNHTTGMYGKKLDHPGNTEFVFAGLRHNVNQIKSFESLDGVWVEEAENVSKNSWETVIPTIRKEGSEIWVTFNPNLSTDDTYKRWVLNPPPGTVVVKTTYRDNLWLSESSRVKLEHLRATDPAAFDHVYEGNTVSAVEGAIFAKEMAAALSEGRICSVPYNRSRPVDTAWDLGYGDLTTIWFLQAYDGFYHFIDYMEGEGQTIADYLVALQGKNYVYGTDWMPHDAVDTIIHRNLAASADKSMSIEGLMRQAGRKIRIAPKIYITDRINAGRTIFPQCRFDTEKCADGLQALRLYQWGPIKEQDINLRVTKRLPLHNIWSHGSDGFMVAAVGIKSKPSKPARLPSQPLIIGDEFSYMG